METLPVHLCLKEVSLLLTHSKFTTIMTIYNYKENSLYCSMILVNDNIFKIFFFYFQHGAKQKNDDKLFVCTNQS